MDVVALREPGMDQVFAPDLPPEASVANDNEMQRFRADLKSNRALAAAVLAQGTDLAGVARLANQFGYAFTADAFEASLRARTRKTLDDRGLAEKGAAWVHMGAPGGLVYIYMPPVVATTVAIHIYTVAAIYIA